MCILRTCQQLSRPNPAIALSQHYNSGSPSSTYFQRNFTYESMIKKLPFCYSKETRQGHKINPQMESMCFIMDAVVIAKSKHYSLI